VTEAVLIVLYEHLYGPGDNILAGIYTFSWLDIIATRLALITHDRWWFVPVLPTLTCILLVMHVRILILYGALEILVGVVAITSSISDENRPIRTIGESIALILAVVG
jgi:hypothetical protein